MIIFLTEEVANKIGVSVVVNNHNEFAQLLDNMVNLATDAYVENDLLRLIDLSLEIENIDTILNFQDALGTIVLERIILLFLGRDELTNMLYEETFDDYHEIVKSKIKTVNTKIGDYLPKKEK